MVRYLSAGSVDRRPRPSDVSSLTVKNAYAERLIGSIRRDMLDHVLVFGERHLRHVLLSYMSYYNGMRTHLSLNKDAPMSRAALASEVGGGLRQRLSLPQTISGW